MSASRCGAINTDGDRCYLDGGHNPTPHSYDAVAALDPVNHPPHYGGDLPTEPIKVIEAWGLGFCLGNAVKYISRAGKKGSALEDLRKAAWYLNREIQRLEAKP